MRVYLCVCGGAVYLRVCAHDMFISKCVYVCLRMFVCVTLYMFVCTYMYGQLCVCVRESVRERQRDRDRDRETEKEKLFALVSLMRSHLPWKFKTLYNGIFVFVRLSNRNSDIRFILINSKLSMATMFSA